MSAAAGHRQTGQRRWVGVAPEGTRPRDLRSSFITLQIYAGTPLTTIARRCGTSVEMFDRQIRRARTTLGVDGGRSVDVGGGAPRDQ